MSRRLPEPFEYFSDNWNKAAVSELRGLLAARQNDPKHSAAITIGALAPYLLGHEMVGTIYVNDVYQRVIGTTMRRVAELAEHTSWRGYENQMRRMAGTQKTLYENEIKAAKRSGLRGDFKRTQAAATEVDLVPVQGDFLTVAGKIGKTAVEAGQRITSVYLTNIGDWMDDDGDPYGRSAITAALRELPLAEDVIIMDSSGPEPMQPRFYCGIESYASSLALQAA